MKKNIKLTDKQSHLVIEKLSSFKNDIFNRVSPKLEQVGGGDRELVVAPFSKAFVQGGWTRSS